MAVERAPRLLPVLYVLEGAVEEDVGGGVGHSKLRVEGCGLKPLQVKRLRE